MLLGPDKQAQLDAKQQILDDTQLELEEVMVFIEKFEESLPKVKAYLIAAEAALPILRAKRRELEDVYRHLNMTLNYEAEIHERVGPEIDALARELVNDPPKAPPVLERSGNNKEDYLCHCDALPGSHANTLDNHR